MKNRGPKIIVLAFDYKDTYLGFDFSTTISRHISYPGILVYLEHIDPTCIEIFYTPDPVLSTFHILNVTLTIIP